MHFLRYCIPLFLVLQCHAHWHGAYYHSKYDGFNMREAWMKDIADNVKLSELALPGTHNSGTFTTSADGYTTQVLNYKEQLSYGIRVFDIYFDSYKFDDILTHISEFLELHSSETVLIKLSADADTYENKNELEKILRRYSKYLKIDTTTTLEEARDKFGIISNANCFNEFGISFNIMNVHDYGFLYTNWDLYGKWEQVKAHLESTKSGDRNIFYVTGLYGYGGSFPYFVASGHSSPQTGAPRLLTGLTTPGWENTYPDFPRIGCFMWICSIAFEGLNILANDNKIAHYNNLMRSVNYDTNRMASIGIKRSVGIIFVDFPGNLLICNIIENNNFLIESNEVYNYPYLKC